METCALPRPSPAPGSPKDGEPPAAAPDGASEEEWPSEPLCPEAEEAPESLFLSEEVLSAGSQSTMEGCPKPLRAQQGLRVHKFGGSSVPVPVCSIVVRVPNMALCQHGSRAFLIGRCLQPRVFPMGRRYERIPTGKSCEIPRNFPMRSQEKPRAVPVTGTCESPRIFPVKRWDTLKVVPMGRNSKSPGAVWVGRRQWDMPRAAWMGRKCDSPRGVPMRRQQDWEWEDKRFQELSLWRDMRVPEDSKWEEGQEPSQGEVELYQALSMWEDVHLQISQWEDSRETELPQVRQQQQGTVPRTRLQSPSAPPMRRRSEWPKAVPMGWGYEQPGVILKQTWHQLQDLGQTLVPSEMRSPRCVPCRGWGLSRVWAQRWQQKQPMPCPEPLRPQEVPWTLSQQLLPQLELLRRSPRASHPGGGKCSRFFCPHWGVDLNRDTDPYCTVPWNSPASSQVPLHMDQNITSEILGKALLGIQALSQQLEEQ